MENVILQDIIILHMYNCFHLYKATRNERTIAN